MFVFILGVVAKGLGNRFDLGLFGSEGGTLASPSPLGPPSSSEYFIERGVTEEY
jgi:hypothetical protein